MRSWEKKYQRHVDKQHKEARAASVEDMNNEAKRSIDELHGILSHTLTIDDNVDWEAIERKDAFRINPNRLFEQLDKPEFMSFGTDGQPLGIEKMSMPVKPRIEDVRGEYGFFSRFFSFIVSLIHSLPQVRC